MMRVHTFAFGGLTLALAGCASAPPQVGPLPYEFTVVQVRDARPADDARLMSVEPFGADKLIQAWRQSVARSLWGSAPATLAMRVTNFESTQSGESYALSLAATLVASQPGAGPSYRMADQRPLAQADTQCSVTLRRTDSVGTRAQAAAAFGPQGLAQGGLERLGALTPAGRDATLWQELWNQCARQLATQFTQALLAGPTEATP